MDTKRIGLLAGLSVALAAPLAQADSLAEVVKQSIGQSPEVAAALRARAAVEQEVRQAVGGYYPKLDAALGYGYEWTDSTTVDDEELNRREASLQLQQLLFDGFATSSEVERQKARLASTGAQLRDISEQFGLDVARAYLDVMRRDTLLQQAKETLYNHVTIYDQIRRRSESGVGSRSAIQQAESRLALAEVNVLAAENNLLDAKANYQRVVGKAVPDELERPMAMELPATLDEAMDIANANQPVLEQADSDVKAAQAQHKAARSNYYPRVYFEAERTWDKNIDGVEGDNEDLTAMVRLRYNLYNGGSDQARVRQTQHQVYEAMEIRNRAGREVTQSLELSWNANQILQRQIEYLRQHVLASEQTRDSYKKQFDIGQRSLLDLLDTENEVFSAKNQLTEAEYDALLAQVRVLNGMGQLLPALAVSLPPQPELEQAAQSTTAGNDAAPVYFESQVE